MDKKITSLEISSLYIYLYKAIFVIGGLNLILGLSTLDTILAIILGSIFGIIILLLYLSLNNYLPEDNIFEKINKTFPKYLSPLFNILLLGSAFILIIYNLYNISELINYSLLPNIDILPISVIFLLMIIYTVYKGIVTISRCSLLSLYIYIIIFIITLVCLLFYPNFLNLLPLTIKNTDLLFKNSIYFSILSSSVILLLLIIPKGLIIDKSKNNKYICITYIIMLIYMLGKTILLLSILGMDIANITKYPEIMLFKKIKLFNFIERIEAFSLYMSLFDNFFMLNILFLYLSKGITLLYRINNKKKTLYFLLFILIIACSNYLRLNNIFYVVISLSIFTLVHIILWLFKKKK